MRAPCAGSRSSSADWVTSTGAAGIRQHEGQPLGRVGWVERQIGAARLEDAEKPDQHLGRALDAQPHHGLRADPEIAQMMRQLIGARIELTIAEALLLEHHGDGVGRPADLGREQLGKVAEGSAWAVSFHSRRMVSRSSAERMSRLPIARSGSATAASSSRTRPPASADTLARSNRSPR